jgi:small subunit ribosomal protein S2
MLGLRALTRAGSGLAAPRAPPPAAAAAAARALSSASTSASGLGGLDPFLRGSSASARTIARPHLSHMEGLRAEALLAARVHLGHQRRRTSRMVTGQLQGFRHNIAIYDINKTWRSMRTLFYAFAEMAASRSSFFLLAPNRHLPLQQRLEQLRAEYPFRHDRFTSMYMTGYADKKWIDGLFSNWKVLGNFASAQRARALGGGGGAGGAGGASFRKISRYTAGLQGMDVYSQIIPDFVLVLATDRGALHEIRNAEVPLLGLADTDTDPSPYLYPVFANDDSLDSINFVLDLIQRGVEEGRRREQEAFALLLVRKIKQCLDPHSGTAAALLAPPARQAEGRGAWDLPAPDDGELRPSWLDLLHPEQRGTRLELPTVGSPLPPGGGGRQ